jgi:oligosaccharyltransferase complex subunit alpha (ribophorin I)
MKPVTTATSLLGLLSSAARTAFASSPSQSFSRPTEQLPSNFSPPQVFKNANLVHIISLEKNYVKETINVVVENIAPGPQDQYYLPFTKEQIERVGGLEIKDKKDAEAGPFEVAIVEYDANK